MADDRLRVILGNGDVVSFLENVLDKARSGEIDAVCICMCGTDAGLRWGWAYKPDAPAPFSRILATVASAQDDLLKGGL